MLRLLGMRALAPGLMSPRFATQESAPAIWRSSGCRELRYAGPESAKLRAMPPAENKKRVRRFYESAWDRGELEIIDDLFADDYVRHDLRPADPAPGPEGMKRL